MAHIDHEWCFESKLTHVSTAGVFFFRNVRLVICAWRKLSHSAVCTRLQSRGIASPADDKINQALSWPSVEHHCLRVPQNGNSRTAATKCERYRSKFLHDSYGNCTWSFGTETINKFKSSGKVPCFFRRLDCKMSSSETKLTHCTLKFVVDAARRASVNRLSMCQGQFTMIVLDCLVL